MTSFLGVPIVLGDSVRGALYAANRQGRADFSDEDQRALELFAERAGVACEIARLHDLARQAVGARERLLAVVSHDLRSPVSAIVMGCEGLQREVPAGEERRKGRRRIDAIRRAAVHMNRLIEDLLTATTLEAGALAINPEPTPVQRIVDEAVQMVEPLATEKSLKLEPRVEGGVPVALCDRGRVVQVLTNLMVNAMKFSPPGTTVRVVARPEGVEVVFSVQDAGPGIPSEQQGHLFDCYWRGDPRAGGGVGLGLCIARGIVLAHRGRIWVDSEVGRGSTFSFALPIVTES